MNAPTGTVATRHYGRIAAHSEVHEASPHRLVQMLLEGALTRVATGKGHLLRGEIQEKNAQIAWAVGIINGLRMSLDHQAGGDIARNLDDLYEYIGRRLIEASREDDVARLDEVSSLLGEIKLGWDAIPQVLGTAP